MSSENPNVASAGSVGAVVGAARRVPDCASLALMDRIFKPPFSMTGAISQDRERCQFLFCLIKNPLLCRAARPESGREAREVSLIAPHARTQSERRRRLALASGFRVLRLSVSPKGLELSS